MNRRIKLRMITKARLIAAAFVLAGVAFAQMARAAGAPPPPTRSEDPGCSAEQGQIYIDEGRYEQAIREFTCLIEAQPTEVEGYRGRIEAELLLGRYSDAVGDYASVTALVLPVHPDAGQAGAHDHDVEVLHRVDRTELWFTS